MGALQHKFVKVIESLPVEMTKQWKKTIRNFPLEDNNPSKAYCRALALSIYPPTPQLIQFLEECLQKHFYNKSGAEWIKAQEVLNNDIRELVEILHVKEEIQLKPSKSNR